MKNRKKIYLFTIFTAIVGLLLFSSCQQKNDTTNSNTPMDATAGKRVEVEGGAYFDLSPEELQQVVEKEDSELLVNVHIPFEGNLPSTDQSIPYSKIRENQDKLPDDKDAKIILYCRSGYMSGIAAKELVKMGYTNVWNLAGGMAAWQQDGLPIEK